MNLIATGKIADYIITNPDSRLTLLTWLKESDYWVARMFANRKEQTPTGFGTGSFQPSTGNIVVTYNINFTAKAVYINDIKTQDEILQDIEARRESQPDYKSHINIVSVELAAPPALEDFNSQDEFKATDDTVSVSSLMPRYDYRQDLKQRTEPESGADIELTFDTQAEYATALKRAVSLFNSQPEEWSYKELMSLLPALERYERQKLSFPTMSLQEVLMQRVTQLEVPNEFLTMVVGGKDNLDDLLNGKVMPDDTLEKIFQILMLRFPLSDKRFFE